MLYNARVFILLSLLFLFSVCIRSEPERIFGQIINALDYGIVTDGQTDDGSAIERMLCAVSQAKGAVKILFPPGKKIRVVKGSERYVFLLDNTENVTVDGQGSTFLLSPDVRFLNLRNSRDITFRNLNVDFVPLPFADGTVVGVNAKERYIDVRPSSSERLLPVGGPTKEDGEQAFFGTLWHQGAYGLVSRHYWIKNMVACDPPGTVRVFADESFRNFGDIKPDEWRISLPVPGIAHRFGPGGCFDLFDNENLTFENIELWSAPWFGFRVLRNSGEVTFRRVNIRPKPGTDHMTSTWRDGFHVKGNSAKLLWEDCILRGMNDDAFNISTHSSRVKQILSPTEIVVLPPYPLNPMPWHNGATLTAADYDSRTLLGRAKIVKVTVATLTRNPYNSPRAHPVVIVLDKPIPGLAEGTMVWEPESSNPDTTLRRCRIENSCRLQTPVTLEECDVTAFLWFHAEKIEGPFPSNVVICDSVFRRGRGNPQMAISFMGQKKGSAGASAIHDVLLKRNKIWGGFSMLGVENARLVDNEFFEPGAAIRIEDCMNLKRSP